MGTGTPGNIRRKASKERRREFLNDRMRRHFETKETMYFNGMIK